MLINGNGVTSLVRIRITCLYNEYTPELHFYIVKLRFTGLYLFFLFLMQNIDVCTRYLELPWLEEAVLMSTYNLCFGPKIRKIGIYLHSPVLLYKSGV